ncbi:MAG: hypothetical protein K8J08_05615 [Thermoanaerobaculia bacterium]|nr:hypothetical protein [Thermoanaerobaculia bacterium]
MERVVRVYESFADADRADIEYYRSLSPLERLDIALELARRHREAIGQAGTRLVRVHRVVELARS